MFKGDNFDSITGWLEMNDIQYKSWLPGEGLYRLIGGHFHFLGFWVNGLAASLGTQFLKTFTVVHVIASISFLLNGTTALPSAS
jgi:hypothetical protein